MDFKPLTEGYEWQWIKERARVIGSEDSQGIVAYDHRGIQAIVVADTFTDDACSVHFAIDSPFAIRSGLFHEVSRHLYLECGRNRLFGTVPSTNKKALKLDKHIGFTEVATIPNGIREGVDLIVMVMEKRDCPWLPEEIRQEAA